MVILCHCGNFSNDISYEHVHEELSSQLLFIVHPLLVCYILHPDIFVMKYCHGWFPDDRELDEKALSKWQQSQQSKSMMLKSIYKGWWIMLGLHLVLVTLHMCFAISIEWDK